MFKTLPNFYEKSILLCHQVCCWLGEEICGNRVTNQSTKHMFEILDLCWAKATISENQFKFPKYDS